MYRRRNLDMPIKSFFVKSLPFYFSKFDRSQTNNTKNTDYIYFLWIKTRYCTGFSVLKCENVLPLNSCLTKCNMTISWFRKKTVPSFRDDFNASEGFKYDTLGFFAFVSVRKCLYLWSKKSANFDQFNFAQISHAEMVLEKNLNHKKILLCVNRAYVARKNVDMPLPTT